MYSEEHEDAADFAPEKMTPEQRFTELAGLLATGLLRIQKGARATPSAASEKGGHGHSPAISHAQEMT